MLGVHIEGEEENECVCVCLKRSGVRLFGYSEYHPLVCKLMYQKRNQKCISLDSVNL